MSIISQSPSRVKEEPQFTEEERVIFPEVRVCTTCAMKISSEATKFDIQYEFKGLELNNNYMVTKKDKIDDQQTQERYID